MRAPLRLTVLKLLPALATRHCPLGIRSGKILRQNQVPSVIARFRILLTRYIFFYLEVLIAVPAVSVHRPLAVGGVLVPLGQLAGGCCPRRRIE